MSKVRERHGCISLDDSRHIICVTSRPEIDIRIGLTAVSVSDNRRFHLHSAGSLEERLHDQVPIIFRPSFHNNVKG
jgi:hypothetical protein